MTLVASCWDLDWAIKSYLVALMIKHDRMTLFINCYYSTCLSYINVCK